MVDATTMHKQVLVLRLISKYRTLGMFAADLDPLKQHAPDYVEDLDLRTYGFTTRTSTPSSTSARTGRPRADAPARPRRVAAGDLTRTLGAEYMYITDTGPSGSSRSGWSPSARVPRTRLNSAGHILERLTAAETLERYLHTKYVGQKRFSARAATR